jgi:hypothetical protein
MSSSRFWVGVLEHPHADKRGVVVLDRLDRDISPQAVRLYNFRTNEFLELGKVAVQKLLRPLEREESGLQDAAVRSYLDRKREQTESVLAVGSSEPTNAPSRPHRLDCEECQGTGMVTNWPECTEYIACPVCSY